MLDFVHYHQNSVIPQDVLVQLPLRLNAEDLLAKPRRGKLPTRPPNNFLIFKTAYTRVLQSQGYWDLRMREVTSNAAAAWKRASREVREECRKLAVIAKKRHEEVYGPPPRQTRKRRQNNKRRPPTVRRTPSSPDLPTQPITPPIIYDEDTTAASLNPTESYYYELIQDWPVQEIPYEMLGYM